jgi:hypothetical protein
VVKIFSTFKFASGSAPGRVPRDPAESMRGIPTPLRCGGAGRPHSAALRGCSAKTGGGQSSQVERGG